jgi:hypothetical protein
MRWLVAIILFASPGLVRAQERDFLTADEADQIRETQEPNLRLKLYAKFAQERVDLLNQLFSKEKAGRSALIHDTLEDYAKIIDSIDTVADDALKRKVAIGEAMKVVADAEKSMLEALRKLDEKPGKDYSRYEFAMKQAIETTSDSAELSTQDLGQRATEVMEQQKREKAEREAMTPKKDVEQKQAAEKHEADKKRKAPTLRRKGEVVPDDQKQP